MNHYYVNKNAQPTGEHEVHIDGCSHFADKSNRKYLGYFLTCKKAIIKAREYYSNVDGCFYCCPQCHNR